MGTLVSDMVNFSKDLEQASELCTIIVSLQVQAAVEMKQIKLIEISNQQN